ncbi:MAG: hypothetical protein ACR2OU_04665 [Thermomicrobiales bacterium]
MMKTKMVYQWGRRTHAIDPQIAGDVIEDITRQSGSCSPAELVDVARDAGSPLHPLFTWDDEAAAEHWRVHEARNVINSLTVTVVCGDKEIIAPAFISVGHTSTTKDAGIGYRPFSVVIADPDFTQETLDDVISALRSLQAKYAAIRELAPVWKALEEVIAA